MTGRELARARWRLVPLPDAVGLLVSEHATTAEALLLVAQLVRLRRSRGHRTLVLFTDEQLTRDETEMLRELAPDFWVRVVDRAQWQGRYEGGASLVREEIERAAQHDVVALSWPQSITACGYDSAISGFMKIRGTE